jgi:hypothetical protein
MAKWADVCRSMASYIVRGRSPLLAAVGVLAVVFVSPAASFPDARPTMPTHVPGFDLLKQPTTLAALPLSERVPLRKALGDRPVRGLHLGEVRFTAGRIRAVGNRAVVCLFDGIESYGAGACASRRSALRHGISFISLCAGQAGDRARIAGIVPNGVVAVRLRRAEDDSPLRVAKVASNAFTMIVPPVEALVSWIGSRSGTVGLSPLKRLAGESECSTLPDRP